MGDETRAVQDSQSPQFDTAMIHLFRGEVTRANVWRQRLDATTNWAVLTTGAALSLVFGQANSHHASILLIMLLITLFLALESRRYRYYELWSARVRLLECHYFAQMLAPEAAVTEDWRAQLAETLRNPRYPLTMIEALGRRLRRNYLWIFLLLWFVWLVKISALPSPIASFDALATRASIGAVSGITVLFLSAGFISLMVGIALLSPILERDNKIIAYDRAIR